VGSNDILGTYGRRAKKNAVKGSSGGQRAPSPDKGRVWRSAAVQDCYDSLGDLLAAGVPIRLVTNLNNTGAGTWTLKAVLDLPEGSAGVYMHGTVKNASDIPAVIDYCLQRGDWREDKYWTA